MPHGAGAIAAYLHRHPRNEIDIGTCAPMPHARPRSCALCARISSSRHNLGRLQDDCHGSALANRSHAHHHRAAHGTGRYRLGITASTDRANTPTISVATMRDSVSKHDNNAALQAWRDARHCDAEVMTQLARTQLKARRTHAAPHCLSTYPSKGAAHGDQDN
ncbi:hypothetical protein PUV44_13870 [Xanthomonas arboricola pv. corylina]|nr:hypothetical protein PUV44_13870 [Xanthomonas arboricola pv. corylina]